MPANVDRRRGILRVVRHPIYADIWSRAPRSRRIRRCGTRRCSRRATCASCARCARSAPWRAIRRTPLTCSRCAGASCRVVSGQARRQCGLQPSWTHRRPGAGQPRSRWRSDRPHKDVHHPAAADGQRTSVDNPAIDLDNPATFAASAFSASVGPSRAAWRAGDLDQFPWDIVRPVSGELDRWFGLRRVQDNKASVSARQYQSKWQRLESATGRRLETVR